MKEKRFKVEPLGSRHRAAKRRFVCGVSALDAYLKERAGQDMRHGVAVTYVLWDEEREEIAGFYSLSAGSTELLELPAEVSQQLPRYPVVPVVLLGRLALSSEDGYRGHGLGGALLVDALRRARDLSRQIGAVGVIVDAKNQDVQRFYERYGFLPFPDEPERLIMSMGTIDRL